MSTQPDDFATSTTAGPHAILAKMAGSWRGTIRTWFEPGVLADESPVEGTLRLVLGGRFLLHEYRASLQGRPFEGMALYGWHIQRGRWEAAWVDTFHNGTAIMYSVGGGPERLDVLGSYPAPEGPDWGWRTELEPTEQGVVVRHHNVTPDGDEALAVEIVYRSA